MVGFLGCHAQTSLTTDEFLVLVILEDSSEDVSSSEKFVKLLAVKVVGIFHPRVQITPNHNCEKQLKKELWLAQKAEHQDNGLLVKHS